MITLSNRNDLDFRNEYDSEQSVYYNEHPFTGVLKIDREEIKYINGMVSHIIRYHRNGQKWSEEYWKEGALLESYSWFENGKVESEWKNDHHFFNEPGTVLRTGYRFYPGGTVQSEAANGTTITYAPSGEIVGETRWTPNEKYFKEFYLDGHLKYQNEIASYLSKHYLRSGEIIIEESSIPGKIETRYIEPLIEKNIRVLFQKEGEQFGFESIADNIRVNKLNQWLTSEVKSNNPEKYVRFNFILCFCENKEAAHNAFTRLTKLDATQELLNTLTKPEDVSSNDAQAMIDKIKQAF